MDMSLTLGLAAGFAASAVFCAWRGAQPPDLARGPRMVPWRLLMMLSATGLLILVVHLVNLMGVTTGRNSFQ